MQNAVRNRGIQFKATFDDMTGGRGSVGQKTLRSVSLKSRHTLQVFTSCSWLFNSKAVAS